jgi:hypothetical protein
VFPPRSLDDLEELANYGDNGHIFDRIPEWPRLVEHYRRQIGGRPGSVYEVVEGLANVLAAGQHCARVAVKFLPLADVLVMLERQEKKVAPATRVRDQALEARDEWIYRQCCDTSQPLMHIVQRLREECRRQGWRVISTIQGIRRAAANYAGRHGLDRPPRRQDL